MDYFLIPGRHPELSAAELWAVAEREGLDAIIQTIPNAVILTPPRRGKDLDTDLPSWLGGMVKFGEIVKETTLQNIISDAADLAQVHGGRDFGISLYTRAARLKNLGLEVKRALRERGIKSRWVTSREPTLSAVVVKGNSLLGPGIELCVFEDGKKLLIGKTTHVQAFEEFSFRDYGRPRRDIRSGMLPVKLARMLVNLSRTPRDGVLLDPFCGSGTIVTEAALLGVRTIIGSDLEEKAITDTDKNVEWTRKHFDISSNIRVLRSPAEKIGDALRGTRVDGVATEPYLGPPLRGRERPQDIQRIINELSSLYLDAFSSFRKILAPHARIAIVFPVFRSTSITQPLPILDQLRSLGFIPSPLLPKNFPASSFQLPASNRGSLLYERPDQRVLREVFVFQYHGGPASGT